MTAVYFWTTFFAKVLSNLSLEPSNIISTNDAKLWCVIVKHPWTFLNLMFWQLDSCWGKGLYICMQIRALDLTCFLGPRIWINPNYLIMTLYSKSNFNRNYVKLSQEQDLYFTFSSWFHENIFREFFNLRNLVSFHVKSLCEFHGKTLACWAHMGHFLDPLWILNHVGSVVFHLWCAAGLPNE